MDFNVESISMIFTVEAIGDSEFYRTIVPD